MEPEPRAEEPKLNCLLEPEPKLQIAAPAPQNWRNCIGKKSWLLKVFDINQIKEDNFQGILENYLAGAKRNIFGSTTLLESLSKYFYFSKFWLARSRCVSNVSRIRICIKHHAGWLYSIWWMLVPYLHMWCSWPDCWMQGEMHHSLFMAEICCRSSWYFRLQ